MGTSPSLLKRSSDLNGEDKYELVQNAILSVLKPNPMPPPEPPPTRRTSHDPIQMVEQASLFDSVQYLAPTPVLVKHLLEIWMEDFGQWQGFLLCTHPMVVLPAPIHSEPKLEFLRLQDVAYVFIDGKCSGVQKRGEEDGIRLAPPFVEQLAKGASVSILIESMGRANFGHEIGSERKGFADVAYGNISLTAMNVHHWQIWPLPLHHKDLLQIPFAPIEPRLDFGSGIDPRFYRGEFIIPCEGCLADTYIHSAGWTKGMVWVNGFNLGRYWDPVGPQHTLYVPKPVLQVGLNTVVVFELFFGPRDLSMDTVSHPCFDFRQAIVPSSGSDLTQPKSFWESLWDKLMSLLN